MAKSALVIGIGSSGYHLILSALRYHYEYTKKKEAPNNVAFLFLETASQDSEEIRNGLVSYVKIGSANITATVNGWNASQKKDLDLSWVPSPHEMKDLHDGADGKPAFGRFCLWSELTQVRQMIQSKYQSLGGNVDTNIYIAGTLMGGTGAGIFLDVAGLVRTETGCPNIYGMFLLPSSADLGIAGKEMGFENAYLSLKTLDYYSTSNPQGDGKTQGYYCSVVPTGANIQLNGAPFRHSYFFTRDFNSANASLPDVAALVDSVGFNLAMRLMDITVGQAPFQDLVNARVADFTAHIPNGIFASIGMRVFQYPAGLLEELLATTLIKEKFLDSWSDSQYCTLPDGKKREIGSLKGLLEVKARQTVEVSIEDSIRYCRGLLKNDENRDKIQKVVQSILDKKYLPQGYDSAIDYVCSLFSVSDASNLYGQISNHEMSLRDALVDSLTNFVYKQSLEFPNIKTLKQLLETLANEIRKVTTKWKAQFQIDGTAETWSKEADEIIRNRMQKGALFYTLTACKSEQLYEAVDGVMQLCYFNVAINVMKSIADSIEGKGGCAPLRTNNHTIPTINALDKIANKVLELLDPLNDA